MERSREERRRFARLWDRLPSSQQTKVKNLAVAGESAPDPETAWLVVMWAERHLRRMWWWYLPQGVVLLGGLTALLLTVGPWALMLLPFTLLSVATIPILWRLRRAVLGNETIAVTAVGRT